MPPTPPNNVRKDPRDEPLFVTWQDPSLDQGKSMKLALATASRALSNRDTVINRSDSYQHAIATNIFQNIAPGNTSIRDSFSRRDYEMFRPGEQIPRRTKDIIVACNEAYRRIGLIRNIIDLMSDFTVQGIDIVHTQPQIQNFYQQWFRRVRGAYVSERFANQLYRVANVIVKRTLAKLTKVDRDNLERGTANIFKEEIDVKEAIKVDRYKIPWRYTMLNPLTVEVMGEEIAPFVGEDGYVYSLKIGEGLVKGLKKPGKIQQDIVSKIPNYIRDAINNGAKSIPLDSKQLQVFYYKKDDWQVWADPFLYSILEDLRMLEKMKLADLAALDGAISHIRLWKLGNLDAKLFPTDAAVGRLATMLLNNVGGGSMDLIWGPDLALEETSTDVHHFLGQEKYTPVLNNIYAGLGIPPTLTGSATGHQGMTNNFISLRTLTERLNYGRQLLIEFWNKEIKIVQRAMGFRFPAQLVFDRPVLTDEATELALLVDLADRGLISEETIQDRFGMVPEIERIRTKREARQREDGRRESKTGPYITDKKHELAKIALQQGTVSPGGVGVETGEDHPDPNDSLLDIQGEQNVKQAKIQAESQKNQLDHQYRTDRLQLKHGVHPTQIALKAGKPKGVSGQGRPPASKDTRKRKQKVVKPRRAGAEFLANLAWAREAQRAIAEVVHPIYLGTVGKENLRQLTTEEAEAVEKLKFAVLCNTAVGSEITEGLVVQLLERPEPLGIPMSVHQLAQAVVQKFVEQKQAQPGIEDLRQIHASVYSSLCDTDEGEELDGED